jgi:hypothetical protein
MVLRIQRLNDGTLAYRAFPCALADNPRQCALYPLKFPNLYIDLRDFIDRAPSDLRASCGQIGSKREQIVNLFERKTKRLRAFYERKTTEKALVKFSIP